MHGGFSNLPFDKLRANGSGHRARSRVNQPLCRFSPDTFENPLAHQKLHRPVATTYAPSPPLVTACATMGAHRLRVRIYSQP